MCARGQKIATVTKLSLKPAQNSQKSANSKRLKIQLSETGKGISWILRQIAKRRFNFSRPPPSTPRPPLHICFQCITRNLFAEGVQNRCTNFLLFRLPLLLKLPHCFDARGRQLLDIDILRHPDTTMPKNSLDYFILNPEIVQVRRKAASECVPGVPYNSALG